MNWKRFGLITAAVLLIGSAGGGYWYYQYRNSPEYAVSEICEAVRNGNSLKFERYVDVESYSSTVIDILFAAAASRESQEPYSGLDMLSVTLGSVALSEVKPVATQAIESMIRDIIETGRLRFDSADVGSRSEVRLANLLAPVGLQLSDFQGVGRIKREGNLATVGAHIYNPVLDTTFVFRAKMEQRGGTWKVTEPYNLQPLTRRIHKWQEELIAEANRKISEHNRQLREDRERRIDRLRGNLFVSDWDVEMRYCTGCPGGKFYEVRLTVTNRSDSRFQNVSVALTPNGAAEIRLSQIAAGRTVTIDTLLDWQPIPGFTQLGKNPNPRINWTTMVPRPDGLKDQLLNWSDYLEYWKRRASTESEVQKIS